jgi:hypothetical protein
VIHESTPDRSHNQLISLKKVNKIAQALDDDDKIRLHLDNAISTRLWIEQLSKEGTHTFYKDKQDLPSDDSELQDAFVLCIQTSFQLNAFQHLGSGFIGIDATHNITQYQDLLLFTIIAQNRWG